jgi:hypothetical protein
MYGSFSIHLSKRVSERFVVQSGRGSDIKSDNRSSLERILLAALSDPSPSSITATYVCLVPDFDRLLGKIDKNFPRAKR